MIFLPILVFVIGLIIGSFLNVVILRMNTGRTVVHGRSICMHCNRELAWYELVPVVSFLALRGRCRTCKREISFQYAFVELVTAILFTSLYSAFVISSAFSLIGWVTFIFSCIVAALAVVMCVYDIRHKIIPDTIVFPFIILALIAVVWQAFVLHIGSFEALLFRGPFVALPFFLIWYFSKGRAMGFGDVKLALGIGWMLGLSAGLTAMLFSFWIGGIVGLFLIALSRTFHLKSEIAFAPFLLAGLAVVAITGVTVQSLFPIWS